MLSRIQDWDNRMLDRISKLRTKRLNKIMVGATTIGNSGLVWFVLAIALLPFQKYRTSGIAIIIAIIVSWLCGEVTIKNIVGRVRPCHKVSEDQLLIKNPPHYSFPSGHTAASFASVTALYLSGERRIGLIALVISCLIAVSRLYLYVHYPTDVLGGIIFGCLSGWLGYHIVKFAEGKKTVR